MNYAEALHFAENLMSLMEEKELTKYRLAKLVPCSPSTVTNWLNGIQPRGLMRTRLLEILNVTENELFGDRTKSPAPKEGEAKQDELNRLFSAADPWIQEQVLSLLRAAESARQAPDGGQ